MSANLEGALSQTGSSETPASNLASESSQPTATPESAVVSQVDTHQSVDDIWGELTKVAPTPEPEMIQVKDDTPDEAASTEDKKESEPSPDNTVEAKEGEDKFEKITEPKKTDWDLIKEDRKAVITKLKEVEPIVQQLEAVGGKQVLDFVAPIFAQYEDPKMGVDAIMAAVKGIHTADPRAGKLHDEATYSANPNKFIAWALEDAGITKEAYADYQKWKSGGQPTVDDVPPPEPINNLVTLPDGTELDMLEPRDKHHYDLLVRDYTYRLQERQREKTDAEAAETKRLADEQTAITTRQATEKAAIDEFVTNTDKVMDEAISGLKFDAGSEKETAMAKLMVMSMSEIMTRGNQDFLTAMNEGRRLAIEGGTLATQKAEAATRIFKANLLSIHTEVMGIFSELHTLRQQAAAGGNLPKIPTAQPQTNQSPLDSLPPAPPATVVNPYDKIWNDALQ